MAEFFQPQQQADPDAIRKAMLLRLFGAAAAGGQPAGVPPGSMMDPVKPINMTPAGTAPSSAQPGAPGTAGSEENAGTPRAIPFGSAPPAAPQNGGRPTAKPITSAAAPNNNSGNPEPGNAPPFLSEADWQKQNPAPTHTPYVAPTFKQRMLEGLFAGMQEFGRPGEGAATMRDYLGNIQKNQEAEANYPQTAAAEAHQRYMTAAEGAKVPIELQNINAELEKRRADAYAKLHPQEKAPRLVKIADPTNQDPHGIPALQHATGEITDQEGKVIPNAKIWEPPQKQERPFNLDEQELEARKALRTAKTPEERAAAQAQIEDIRASRQRPAEAKPPKEARLTPAQKSTLATRYKKALSDIEAESRERASGTYVHPHSGELMSPMTPEELAQRKQRAEDDYKDELEAGGEPNVRRFNYATGQYEGGEPPAADKTAKPLTAANAGAKPQGNAAPPQHKVNDEVMYQGKRHKITAIQNGKATLQPLE